MFVISFYLEMFLKFSFVALVISIIFALFSSII